MEASFDFQGLIAAANVDTLPRTQIESALHEWLDAAPAGVLVLRGEPGSGKTCIVARQLREHGGLHHFLRHGHTEHSLWRDPHGFLVSIGFQLKDRFGPAIFPSGVAIDVNQQVHALEAGGMLTGIQIDRLFAVPWMQTQLRVQQHIAQAAGQAAALQIGELVEEYHRVPLNVFREMALMEPLRRLRTQKPEVRVTLWVDALDEDPGSENGIAAVLPAADELRAVGNLQLVLSSRPGLHLDRFVDSGAVVFDLADARFEADRRAFIDAYVARALAAPPVQAALAAAKVDPATLTQALATRAEDNPLYLAQFFDAVRAGDLAALLQGELPLGLDAIQARLVGALAVRAGDGFRPRVFPLLQILSAARQSLRLAQLSRFTGLDEGELVAGLKVLEPFLNVEGTGSQARHALYHRSFQETLIAPAHQGQAWHVDAPTAHDRLSAAYMAPPDFKPTALDDYGFEFLAAHLAAGTPPWRSRLLDLPDAAWWRMRRQDAGSLWPLLADLALALQVAQTLPPAQAIPVAARLSIIGGSIHDAEHDLPDGLLRATVRAGQIQRALGSVSPEMDIVTQVDRLGEIAGGLVVRDRAEGTASSVVSGLCLQILRQALSLLRRDAQGFALAGLLEACPTDAAGQLGEWLVDATELARSLPAGWQRPRALIELARLYSKVDAPTAEMWFRTALGDCHENLRSSLSYEQLRLVKHWLAFKPTIASNLLPRLKLSTDAGSVQSVLAIAQALRAAGQRDAAIDLAKQIQHQLSDFANPYELALAEVAVGQAWADAGDVAAAEAALERACAAAGRIGTDGDPERELQNRPVMMTDAQIAVAHLALDLTNADAESLIEAAWTAYTQRGSFNRSCDELVALQLRSEPALLEVYLGQIGDVSRRTKARLAAVDALFDAPGEAERALAVRWHRQAVLEAEQSAAVIRELGPFPYAAAVAAPPERTKAALDLAASRLGPDEQVAAQLCLWPRLPGSPSARVEALVQTIQIWAEKADNPNYAFDLPAALLELAPDVAAAVSAYPMPPGPPVRHCLLGLALGALMARQQIAGGRERFEESVAQIPGAATDLMPAALLQAFAAGAWWTCDAHRAGELWASALLWLNSRPAFDRDAGHRHFWLMLLTRALEAGAPQAALQVYLANREPDVEPGVLRMIAPGPLVDAANQAGMSQRDRQLGLALAKLWPSVLGPMRDALADLLPPAARALALATARSGSAATRLKQIDSALDAALLVDPPSLRWLLFGKGVLALSVLGAHQQAMARSSDAVKAVLSALPVFGTQPVAGYAAALGSLATAALLAGDTARAATLIFEARRMGSGGVYRALAEICEPLAHLDAGAWDALLRETARVEADSR